VALVAITIFSAFVLWFIFSNSFKRTKREVKEATPQANQRQVGTQEDDTPLLNRLKDSQTLLTAVQGVDHALIGHQKPNEAVVVAQTKKLQEDQDPLNTEREEASLVKAQEGLTAKKSCAARLALNCKDAENQQALEVSRNFSFRFQPNGPFFTELLVEEAETDDARKVGIATYKGTSLQREDQEIFVSHSFMIQNTKYLFNLFGVFDGYRGGDASAYVKKNILVYLTQAIEGNNKETLTEEGIFNALKECFKRLDADYKQSDGTTAMIALILAGHLWVANVGDSRTILVTGDKIVQASEDAKRSITRGIGHKDILASPSPKITCYPLKDFQEGYLVLASEGLYYVATTKEVGNAIQEMAKANQSTTTMSKQLVHNAIFGGLINSVTVLVVNL